MFGRYMEKARRVIFFTRYEASQFGSLLIEPEHLLLGVLREDTRFARTLPTGAVESTRKRVEELTPPREKVTTSVDLPLSNSAKRVLVYAEDEADRLHHRHIACEHMVLGYCMKPSPQLRISLETLGSGPSRCGASHRPMRMIHRTQGEFFLPVIGDTAHDLPT